MIHGKRIKGTISSNLKSVTEHQMGGNKIEKVMLNELWEEASWNFNWQGKNTIDHHTRSRCLKTNKIDK
jgi:hypothetical protein